MERLPPSRSDTVAEQAVEYNAGVAYKYRDADYETKCDEGRNPELGRAPKDGLRGFTNGLSIVRPR